MAKSINIPEVEEFYNIEIKKCEDAIAYLEKQKPYKHDIINLWEEHKSNLESLKTNMIKFIKSK